MRHLIYVITIIISLIGLTSFRVFSAETHDFDLRPSSDGKWVVYALPAAWQKKYAPESPSQTIWIVLDAPAPTDILENDYPCFTPVRIYLLSGKNDRKLKTDTIYKSNFCESEWKPPASVSWAHGPDIKVSGLNVTLKVDGSLIVDVIIEKGVKGKIEKTGKISLTINKEKILAVVSR